MIDVDLIFITNKPSCMLSIVHLCTYSLSKINIPSINVHDETNDRRRSDYYHKQICMLFIRYLVFNKIILYFLTRNIIRTYIRESDESVIVDIKRF